MDKLRDLPPHDRGRDRRHTSYQRFDRSKSPSRHHISGRSHSPQPHSRRNRSPRPRAPSPRRHSFLEKGKSDQDFQRHAEQRSGPSVCTVCLGRKAHNIYKCRARLLWDRSNPAYVTRSEEGHLTNPNGARLCYDWQRPNGCSNSLRAHGGRHECSGCGEASHGAQTCPHAENTDATHTL